MGTQSFKEFVHQLLSDAAFRDRFVSAPDVTMAQSSLQPEEKAALLRLNRRLAGATPDGSIAAITTEVWP